MAKEHRRIVEKYIGRLLRTCEHVHHIDINKYNNDPSNLYVFEKGKLHYSLHRLLRSGHLKPDVVESNLDFLKAGLSHTGERFENLYDLFVDKDVMNQIKKHIKENIEDTYPWETEGENSWGEIV